MPQRPTRIAPVLVLCVAALLLAVAAPAATAPAATQAGELPEELRSIAGVRFLGQHHLGRRLVVAAGLHTRRPSVLPWRERPQLRRDYLRSDSAAIVSLYRHYGYLDATVGVKLLPGHDPRTAYVEFEIREGALTRVSRVELDGVNHYPVADLRRGLLAQPQRAFDPAFLQLDVTRIRTLYQERGYLVGVDTLSRRGLPDSAHVEVRYGVDEGPEYRVGRIEYIGSPKQIRDRLGRRELLLKPGDLFRMSRLDLSKEHMYSTGLFRQVQVTQLPDTATGTMDLLVRIQPRPARWVDVGVGSGTSDRFRTTAQWGHRNIDTRALGGVLDGELAWYGDGRPHKNGAAATLTEPWLFGVRLLGQAGVFYRNQHDEAYNDQGEDLYTQHAESRGFSFSISRELSRIARMTVLEEDALVYQSYTIDAPRAQVADSTVARLESQTIPRYRSNTLRATLERDTRNDRITPSRGSYQSLVPEFAGGWLKGQSSYRKAAFSSIWYVPYANGWLGAMRTMVGVMGPYGPTPKNFTPDLGLDAQVAHVPRESRFFIGGVNSLRGYGENAVTLNGGLAVALANAELRIPVAGPFGIEIFLDAGNVWDRPEYVRVRDFVLPWQATSTRPGDVRYAYGLGGRLVLPFGPLRVDVARADRPDFPFTKGRHGRDLPFAYQFAIGPSF